MIRRLAVVSTAIALALLLAACSSSGGDGAAGGGGVEDGPDAGDDTSDASLIPPSDATNPTSGPPNTDPLAGAAAPDGGTCEGREASPSAAAEDLELRVQLGETLETGRVRWSLTLANRGDDTVTLVYSTSQDGDVVLRRGGEAVYRWSDGKMFSQQLRCQLLGAGQEYRFDLGGTELAVTPGDYELVATLSADPTPEPARIDVTVAGPGG